jgi:hypothetical protein
VCKVFEFRFRSLAMGCSYSIANLASSLLLRSRHMNRPPKLSVDHHVRAQNSKDETKLSATFHRLSLIEPKTHAAKLAMDRWMQETDDTTKATEDESE